jgi:hypothetical protein
VQLLDTDGGALQLVVPEPREASREVWTAYVDRHAPARPRLWLA